MFPPKQLQRLQIKLSKQDGKKHRARHATDDLQILLIHLQKLQAGMSLICSSFGQTAASSTVHIFNTLHLTHVELLSLTMMYSTNEYALDQLQLCLQRIM